MWVVQISKGRREKKLFEKGDELFLIIDPTWNLKFKFQATTREGGWGLKAKMRSVTKNTISVT